jgi:hypothetical protein
MNYENEWPCQICGRRRCSPYQGTPEESASYVGCSLCGDVCASDLNPPPSAQDVLVGLSGTESRESFPYLTPIEACEKRFGVHATEVAFIESVWTEPAGSRDP